MRSYVVKILSKEPVTHDVSSFRVERPDNYDFLPGQATEISVNVPTLAEERRPFTFTSLVSDPFLEFTIKKYNGGITEKIHNLSVGNELLLHDIFGEITFREPGVFIAGGAGITPFLAILRDLKAKNNLQGNYLIFGNKTSSDVIRENELKEMLGGNFISVLSQERHTDHYHGLIDIDFLETHIPEISTFFYVCGPPGMTDNVVAALIMLGALNERIIIEGM